MFTTQSKDRRLPTSADVARAANVSRTTVSFVLNKTPGQHISAATRKRIWDAARRLGYQPNTAARALSRGVTDEIVFVIGENLPAHTLKDWMLAIQRRADELGYAVGMYVHPAQLPPRAWRAKLKSIFARHPAGIIASTFSIGKAEYRLAQRMGVRACALYTIGQVDYGPALDMFDDQIVEDFANLLDKRGYRRVAFAVPAEQNPIVRASMDRMMSGLGAHLGASVPLTSLPMDGSLTAAQAAVATIEASDGPAAIYLYSNDFCLPLLRALRERNLNVPRDVAIIVAGDSPLCAATEPALTAIRVDNAGVGARLVDIIDAQAHGRTPDPELFRVLPPKLIVRDSS